MLHYWLPLSPSSNSRFDPDLWQAYVKANKVGVMPACAQLLLHHPGPRPGCMQLYIPIDHIFTKTCAA